MGRSLDLAQDFDAALKMIQLSWLRVGLGGCTLQQFARILLELLVLTGLLELCILMMTMTMMTMIRRTLPGAGQMVGVDHNVTHSA